MVIHTSKFELIHSIHVRKIEMTETWYVFVLGYVCISRNKYSIIKLLKRTRLIMNIETSGIRDREEDNLFYQKLPTSFRIQKITDLITQFDNLLFQSLPPPPPPPASRLHYWSGIADVEKKFRTR